MTRTYHHHADGNAWETRDRGTKAREIRRDQEKAVAWEWEFRDEWVHRYPEEEVQNEGIRLVGRQHDTPARPAWQDEGLNCQRQSRAWQQDSSRSDYQQQATLTTTTTHIQIFTPPSSIYACNITHRYKRPGPRRRSGSFGGATCRPLWSACQLVIWPSPMPPLRTNNMARSESRGVTELSKRRVVMPPART